MKNIYLILMSVFISSAAISATPDNIGTFWKAKKTTIESKPAKKGTKIGLGSVIQTSKSSRAKAEIMTIDDSRYLIFKNTSLKFDKLDMDGSSCEGLKVTLVSGKIRSTSGKCGDGKTEIKTSLGSAFAWGTDYDLVYVPEGKVLEGYEDVKPGFYQRVNEGQVKVENEIGSIMVNPGEASFMSFDRTVGPLQVPVPDFFTNDNHIIGKPTQRVKDKQAKIKDLRKSIGSKRNTNDKKKVLFGLINVDSDSMFAWLASDEEPKKQEIKKKPTIAELERVVYYDPEAEEDKELIRDVVRDKKDLSRDDKKDNFIKKIFSKKPKSETPKDPKTEEPKSEDPVVDPKPEEPKSEDPVVDPKPEEPKSEDPVVDPKPEEPIVEEPIVEEPKKTVVSRKTIEGEVIIKENPTLGETIKTTPTRERIVYSDGTEDDILKSELIEVTKVSTWKKEGKEFTVDDKSPRDVYRNIISNDPNKVITELRKEYRDKKHSYEYKYQTKTRKTKIVDASGKVIVEGDLEVIYQDRKDPTYKNINDKGESIRSEFVYREINTTKKSVGDWINDGDIVVGDPISDSEKSTPTEISSDGKVEITKFYRENKNIQPQVKKESTIILTEYFNEDGTLRDSFDSLPTYTVVEKRDFNLDPTLGEHLYSIRKSQKEEVLPWVNVGQPSFIGIEPGVEWSDPTENISGVSRTKHYYTNKNQQTQKQYKQPYLLTERLDPTGDLIGEATKVSQGAQLEIGTRQKPSDSTKGSLKRVEISGREDVIFNTSLLDGNNIVISGGNKDKFVGGSTLKAISSNLYDDLFDTLNGPSGAVDLDVSIDGGSNVKYQVTPSDKRSDYSSFLYTKSVSQNNKRRLKSIIGTPAFKDDGSMLGYKGGSEVLNTALHLKEIESENKTINAGGSTIHYGVGVSAFSGGSGEHTAFIYEDRSNDFELAGDNIGMKLPKSGLVEYEVVEGASSKILITSTEDNKTKRDEEGRLELNGGDKPAVDLKIDFGKDTDNVQTQVRLHDKQKNKFFESSPLTTTLRKQDQIGNGSNISGYFMGSTAGNITNKTNDRVLIKEINSNALPARGDLSVSGVMMGNKGSHVGMGYNQTIDLDGHLDVASGTALLKAKTYNGASASSNVVFTDVGPNSDQSNDSSWGWWKVEAEKVDQGLGISNPSLMGDIENADGETKILYDNFINGMDSSAPMNLRKSGTVDYDIRSNTNLTINAEGGPIITDKYKLTDAGLNIDFSNSEVDTTITVSEKDSTGTYVNPITGSSAGSLNSNTGIFTVNGGYMGDSDSTHDIKKGMFGANGRVLDEQGSNAGMEFKMAVEDIDVNNPLNNNTVKGLILFKEK